MLDHPLASAGIAWCQISGCVTSPNPAAALHWVALLQRTDPGLARYLEWHAAKAMAPLADPPPQPIAPDQGAVQAAQPLRHLLVAAAGAGNPQALNELGLEDLAAGHIEPVLGWFRAAAPRSAAAAANVRLLESRVQSSANAARPLARQSANDWFLQARKYHRGDGVPSNYAEAIRLYQIAASSGSAQARKMLELIFSRPAPGGEVDIAWMQQLAALEVSASGASSGATAPWASYGWQRDPSPLYALVPPEWRSPEPPPPALKRPGEGPAATPVQARGSRLRCVNAAARSAPTTPANGSERKCQVLPQVIRPMVQASARCPRGLQCLYGQRPPRNASAPPIEPFRIDGPA